LARRKQKHLVDAKLFLAILAILACIGIVLENPQTFLVLLAVVVAVIVIVQRVRRDQHTALRNSLLAKANAVVEHQTDALVRRRAQLVQKDAYGKWQTDKWEQEIESFITQHVLPPLTKEEQFILERERSDFARSLNERIEAATRDRPAFKAFSDTLTPSEFEFFCAGQLRLSGWDAHVTQQSRDQGVDVIAEKGNVRVVLQCKLYSGAVSNKAVQEVVAGKAHQQAHHAAVVTNNRYTSAAQQLASTNGVLLLHYSDLIKLDALLFQRTVSPR